MDVLLFIICERYCCLNEYLQNSQVILIFVNFSFYFLYFVVNQRKRSFAFTISISLIWIAGCKMWYVDILLLFTHFRFMFTVKFNFFRKIFFNQSSNFRFTVITEKLRLIPYYQKLLFLHSLISQKSPLSWIGGVFLCIFCW